jgi:hypothetical protein
MLGSTLRACFDIDYVTELVPVRVGQCSCSFCTSHRLGSFEVGQLYLVSSSSVKGADRQFQVITARGVFLCDASGSVLNRQGKFLSLCQFTGKRVQGFVQVVDISEGFTEGKNRDAVFMVAYRVEQVLCSVLCELGFDPVFALSSCSSLGFSNLTDVNIARCLGLKDGTASRKVSSAALCKDVSFVRLVRDYVRMSRVLDNIMGSLNFNLN